MDIEAISTLGFPIVACYVLYQALVSRMKQQDKRIEKLELENKEDKKLFNKAIDIFNASVAEFKENNREVKQIKEDVEIIKNKLN